MNYNLMIMSGILDNYLQRSYVEDIKSIYKAYRFTEKQKIACEIFLFEPNKKNAIQALEFTPKSWLFVENYLKKDKEMEREVIDHMSILIETGKLTRRYMRMLVVNDYLEEYLKKLSSSDHTNTLERYVKQYEMESKLKNNK